jgi:hypothetical protein
MSTEFYTDDVAGDFPRGTLAVVRYWGGYETGVRYEILVPVGPDAPLARHAPGGAQTTLRGEMAQLPAGNGRDSTRAPGGARKRPTRAADSIDLRAACEVWRAEGRERAAQEARGWDAAAARREAARGRPRGPGREGR